MTLSLYLCQQESIADKDIGMVPCSYCRSGNFGSRNFRLLYFRVHLFLLVQSTCVLIMRHGKYFACLIFDVRGADENYFLVVKIYQFYSMCILLYICLLFLPFWCFIPISPFKLKKCFLHLLLNTFLAQCSLTI